MDAKYRKINGKRVYVLFISVMCFILVGCEISRDNKESTKSITSMSQLEELNGGVWGYRYQDYTYYISISKTDDGNYTYSKYVDFGVGCLNKEEHIMAHYMGNNIFKINDQQNWSYYKSFSISSNGILSVTSYESNHDNSDFRVDSVTICDANVEKCENVDDVDELPQASKNSLRNVCSG